MPLDYLLNSLTHPPERASTQRGDLAAGEGKAKTVPKHIDVREVSPLSRRLMERLRDFTAWCTALPFRSVRWVAPRALGSFISALNTPAVNTLLAKEKAASDLAQNLAQNVKAMLCGAEVNSVDKKKGLARVFLQDVWRRTDIRVGKNWSLQTLHPPIEKNEAVGTEDRKKAIKRSMLDLGVEHLAGNPALMAVFTRVAHQGIFGPIPTLTPALLGLCSVTTSREDLPLLSAAVDQTNRVTRSVELVKCSVEKGFSTLKLKGKVEDHYDAIIKPGQAPVMLDPERTKLIVDFTLEIKFPLGAAERVFRQENEPAETSSQATDGAISIGKQTKSAHRRFDPQEVQVTVSDVNCKSTLSRL